MIYRKAQIRQYGVSGSLQFESLDRVLVGGVWTQAAQDIPAGAGTHAQ